MLAALRDAEFGDRGCDMDKQIVVYKASDGN